MTGINSSLAAHINASFALRMAQRDPCSFANFFNVASYTKHLTFKHISDELSRLQSGELTMDQAELLVSQERVRRTKKYEWVCCVPLGVSYGVVETLRGGETHIRSSRHERKAHFTSPKRIQASEEDALGYDF